MIIALGAAADLLSRVFMAVMSLCVQVKARYIYLAGASFTCIARFGLHHFFPFHLITLLQRESLFKFCYVFSLNFLFSVFLNVFDFIGMAAITAILGFFRTWIHVPLPLVFAEYLSQER